MKKFLLPLLMITAVLSASGQGSAQLNLYTAYTFDDGFSVYNDANTYYHGKLKAGLQVGAGLEYLANPMYGVELLYMYRKADAPATYKVGTLTSEKNSTFNVTHSWIMLSGNSHMKNHDKKIEGTGGFMLGMLISNVDEPTTGSSGSNTTFAWGFKLGGDIWLSDKIALKLQTQLLSSSRAMGGSVYYGYWGPVAVPTYSTLWQYSLGGGLVFKFGH
jgi:hypothetical protein